jgi:radical SAM protein with 4Fe4S-binding SPASM domain
MNKLKYYDKNIDRKLEIVKKSFQFFKNTKIPMPSVIEISDSGTCNRKCIFCPRSDKNYKDVKEFISTELHEKILQELSFHNYKGILVYSGFNEPLLNKNIYKNIYTTRKYLPKASIELITNGDALNLDRLKKLFFSGLSTLLISVYDGKKHFQKFERMRNLAGLQDTQCIIRNRYLSSKKNFGITISNRAGLMKNAIHPIQPLKNSLSAHCYYPSYTFFIDYNGDVLMCSHDWGKKNILGNLNHGSIFEIWNSKKANTSRKSLLHSSREFSPCNVCDVKGDLIGSRHAKLWKKIL